MEVREFLFQEYYRRDAYKLLADCYYLPDEELIETLRSLDKSKGNLFSEIAMSASQANDIEALRIDYSKLFIGPYRLLAPPYGSVYLENTRMVMGNSTLDVRSKYAVEGLSVDIKEAPDHITIELEFMHYLISREVEAILSSDSIGAARYLKKQKDFLDIHLGLWVSDFSNNIDINAETSFYRDLALQTKSFIEADLRSLPQSPTLALQNN
jgi:TorA maturation chaperone TorD